MPEDGRGVVFHPFFVPQLLHDEENDRFGDPLFLLDILINRGVWVAFFFFYFFLFFGGGRGLRRLRRNSANPLEDLSLLAEFLNKFLFQHLGINLSDVV